MTPDSKWMQSVEDRLGALQDEMAANTAITTEVRDLFASFRTGFRVLGGLGTAAVWAGKIAAAALALWGAFYASTHGGRTPGGH